MQLKKSIIRSSFDNELNVILKKISLSLHTHIRTHSFRATIITELLEPTPIQIVKDIMGQCNIKTTIQHNRNKINEQVLSNIMNNIDKVRSRNKNVLEENIMS